jgi:hypothetical protein
MAFSLSRCSAQNQLSHDAMGVDGAHATRDVGTSSTICGKVPNGWFTEGFDTIDLQEARGLLDDLGS